jgi:hypothetical protein
MSSTYEIPEGDIAAFAGLPLKHQVEIRAMLQVFWRVDHAAHGQTMQVWHDAIAEANAYLEIRAAAARFKRQTLYAVRKAFLDAGKDWTACIDGRKAPEWDQAERQMMSDAGAKLPEAFVEHLQGLCMRHNRSSIQAVEELYRAWRRGDSIPGYGIWTSWYIREFPLQPMPQAAPLPAGWSRRNLRRYMPQPAALETARRGVSAGAALLPSIIRTRQGLRPMEYVVFDDWRCDFLVHVPGVAKAVELHGILSMDVASAMALCYGVRPALPRADATCEGLKRDDTKSLLVDLLLRFGYPLDYQMNVIVENGTATITPADAKAVEEVTQGQVKFHWTSMVSGTVFGWPDRPVGNFKGKAWLESFFNLLHNAAGNVAGQIGPHYDARPRSIPAREAELKALVRAQEALPAHLRETMQYRMPFPHIRDAKAGLDHVFHFLNHREHHACEGFDSVLKLRLSEHDTYRPVSELIAAGHSPDAIRALNPRPILETPAERYVRLVKGYRFVRLPAASAPMLLAAHKEVVVETEGEINMGSKSSPVLYRDLRSPHLTVGRKFLAYASTTNDAWVHLTDGRRYICSVARLHAVSMTDREALREASQEKYGQLKRVLKSVQRLDIDAPQRQADVDHNLALAESQYKGCTLLIPGATATAPASTSGVAAAETTLAEEKARREAATERIAKARGGLEAIYGEKREEVGETDQVDHAVAQMADLF